MTTVANTLTEVSVSDVLHTRNQREQVTYSLSGTFDGAVFWLERATTPAMASWKRVDGPFTSDVSKVYTTFGNDHLRWRCTEAGASTSVDTSLADADAIVKEVRDKENEVVLTQTQAGYSIAGTLAVAGATALAGLLTVAGNLFTRGRQFFTQAAPTALTGSATLTPAQVLGGLLTANAGTAAGVTYTLPTGVDMETAMPSGIAVNDSFFFRVVNISTVAAEDATIAPGVGFTVVGTGVVNSNDAGTSISAGTFLVRRTAVETFVAYRVG